MESSSTTPWQNEPAVGQSEKGVSSDPGVLSTSFQLRNLVRPSNITELLEDRVSSDKIDDVKHGLGRSAMTLQMTPYIFSLIDWNNFYTDPIRIQFLPIASEFKPDHPMVRPDSLGEQIDSPVGSIVHRYPNRVLFLANGTCPVYCAFCTRSYGVGPATDTIQKDRKRPIPQAWDEALTYIKQQRRLNDVIISGGDVSMIPADKLRFLVEKTLSIPHVKRVRLATKALCVMPMKFLDDQEWFESISYGSSLARKLSKSFMVQTHFNCVEEITSVTAKAAQKCRSNGISVQNQSVLIRGVNDSTEKMSALLVGLLDLGIAPYYVYVHDLVPHTEHLRTSLKSAIDIEKSLRGTFSGHDLPRFVVDLAGGGGKRDIHSYESYDVETGVSKFTSSIGNMSVYEHHDPIVG